MDSSEPVVLEPAPNRGGRKHKLVTDYTWQDWLNPLWDYQNTGMPHCAQFWFIRDLMIVVLFTPVLYYLIRRCKHSAVPVLGVLWMLDLWFKVPGFGITALFFFSFGAWFGINRHDFTADFRPMRMAAACLYAALVVLETWLWHCHITCPYLHKAGIVAGLVAAVSWTAYGITKKRLPVSALLAGSSFFVFAYHIKPMGPATAYWLKLLSPASDGMLSAGYLLIPFFIAFMGVGIYVFLRKHFPALTALITGGR